MALDVLPKLLCTLVVLLADKGVHASDALLDAYTSINRLLIALAANGRSCAPRSAAACARSSRKRRRARRRRSSNLGTLIPLLALAGGTRWADLAWLLDEMLDVACCGRAASTPNSPPRASGGRPTAAPRATPQWMWEGKRVSGRLLAFHVGFLSTLAKLPVVELDAFHGRCSPWLRATLPAHSALALAVDSWPDFVAALRVPLPPKPALVARLKAAVARSAKKGYHTPGMDFSRVHRSGVSAILRKGESVTASPTMRRITMREVWRWRGDHENLYLDASCLNYGFGDDALARPPLATVDYSSMRSVTGAASSGGGYRSNRGGGVAITHSGDVIDGGRREGKHTIDVDLRALSDEVGALVFTMSAWTGTLRTIVRPEVRCVDPDDRSVSRSPRTSSRGARRAPHRRHHVPRLAAGGRRHLARAGGRRALLRLRQRPERHARLRGDSRGDRQDRRAARRGERGRRAADAGGAEGVREGGRANVSRAECAPFSVIR